MAAVEYLTADELYYPDGQEVHVVAKGKTVNGNTLRVVSVYPVKVRGNGCTVTCMSDCKYYGDGGTIEATRGKVKVRGYGNTVVAKEIDCLNPDDNHLTWSTKSVLMMVKDVPTGQPLQVPMARLPIQLPLPPAHEPNQSALDMLVELPPRLTLSSARPPPPPPSPTPKRKRSILDEVDGSDDAEEEEEEESGPPARKLRRRDDHGAVVKSGGQCHYKFTAGERRGKRCQEMGFHSYIYGWFCDAHRCAVCHVKKADNGRTVCRNCSMPEDTEHEIVMAEVSDEQDVRRILNHTLTGRSSPRFTYLVEWADDTQTTEPTKTFIWQDGDGEMVITQALLDYWE